MRKPTRPSPLDPFIPEPDIDERFAVRIRAPAPLVLAVATGTDLQLLPLVRLVAGGTACQPWRADVVSRPIPPCNRRDPE